MNSTRRAFLLAAMVSVMLGAGLSAHMKLDKSEPAAKATLATAPKHVQIWFTQKPDLAVTKVELQGPSGSVKLAPVHMMGAMSIMAVIEGELADGAYTVRWQAAGDDGHVQKGDYGFTLKRSK